MLRLTTALIATLALLGCNKSPEARAEKVINHLESHLDLSTAQKSELEKLKIEALADIQDLKSERETIANEIQKQLEKGKLDREALKKIAAEERAKRAPLTDKWIDNVVTFHEGLNEKQKQKVLKDVREFKGKISE